MKHPIITCMFCIFALALVFIAGGSQAADGKHGQTLHDTSCITRCHADRVSGPSNHLYTRPDRHSTSLDKLTAQVNFCNQQVLNSEWWPEDVDDVVTYLNTRFYHFQ